LWYSRSCAALKSVFNSLFVGDRSCHKKAMGSHVLSGWLRFTHTLAWTPVHTGVGLLETVRDLLDYIDGSRTATATAITATAAATTSAAAVVPGVTAATATTTASSTSGPHQCAKRTSGGGDPGALFVAISSRHPDIVKLLIQRRVVNVHALQRRTASGPQELKTALVCAAEHGDVASVEALIAVGDVTTAHPTFGAEV
jgi:hypothetical protein